MTMNRIVIVMVILSCAWATCLTADQIQTNVGKNTKAVIVLVKSGTKIRPNTNQGKGEYEELRIKSRGFYPVKFDTKLKGLRIHQLIFEQTGTIIEFVGDNNRQFESLEIAKIITPIDSLGTPTEIRIDGLTLKRLQVSGYGNRLQPFGRVPLNLQILAGSSVRNTNLSNCTFHELRLRASTGKSQIFLSGITTSRIEILPENDSVGLTQTSLDARLEVRLLGSRQELPALLIKGVRLRSGIGNLWNYQGGGKFIVSIEDAVIGEKRHEYALSLKADGSEFRMTNTRLAGSLNLQTIGPSSVLLDGIALLEEPEGGDLVLDSDDIESLCLNHVELRSMIIRSKNSNLKTVQISHLKINDSISIPKIILEKMSEPGINPFQRGAFSRLVQQQGRYSDQPGAINLDAIYFRKYADLTVINSSLAFIIDNLTGLGIRLEKPLRLFIFVVIFFYLFHVWACQGSSFIRRLGNGLTLLLAGSFLGVDGLGLVRNRKMYQIIRGLLRLIFYIQVALLSIYLSQTTLQ